MDEIDGDDLGLVAKEQVVTDCGSRVQARIVGGREAAIRRLTAVIMKAATCHNIHQRQLTKQVLFLVRIRVQFRRGDRLFVFCSGSGMLYCATCVANLHVRTN